MNKSILFIFLLLISGISIFAEDLVNTNITVLSVKKVPIADALVQIGDLSVKTDINGKASISLIPATYDAVVTKDNFYPKTYPIEITSETSNVTFFLESSVSIVNIKIIDASTEQPIISSVKITNSLNNTFNTYSTSKSGDLQLILEKNKLFYLDIEEKNYKKFSYKFDTGKSLSPNLIFKLEKLESESVFNFNIPEGFVNIKSLENTSFSKDYPFINKTLTVNLPFGKYELEIKNVPNYRNLTKQIIVQEEKTVENISLIPTFKSFELQVVSSEESGINFISNFDSIDKNFILKNVLINIYMDTKIVNSIKMDTATTKVAISYGQYDFEVISTGREPFIAKNISITESNNPFILFSLKQLFSTVKGVITYDKSQMGAVSIIFKDPQNNEYKCSSDIDGSYSIKIPQKLYTITIEKEGFKIKNTNELSLSSLLPNQVYELNIDLEEIPSRISGKITNILGDPVPNAKITIKIEKEDFSIYTLEDGSFSTDVKSGLIIIKIEKPGYKSKGTIKTINKYSTVTGMNFKLDEIYSTVDGVLTDGVNPLKGLQLILTDETGKKIIAKTITKDNGSFLFDSLRIFSKYRININTESYVSYTSDVINLNYDPITKFNIILKKNVISFIFEIKDENKNPIPNVELLLNGTLYTTDINGFAEIECVVKQGIKHYNLIIPKYDYNKTITIEDIPNAPLKEEIIIKEITPLEKTTKLSTDSSTSIDIKNVSNDSTSKAAISSTEQSIKVFPKIDLDSSSNNENSNTKIPN